MLVGSHLAMLFVIDRRRVSRSMARARRPFVRQRSVMPLALRAAQASRTASPRRHQRQRQRRRGTQQAHPPLARCREPAASWPWRVPSWPSSCSVAPSTGARSIQRAAHALVLRGRCRRCFSFNFCKKALSSSRSSSGSSSSHSYSCFRRLARMILVHERTSGATSDTTTSACSKRTDSVRCALARSRKRMQSSFDQMLS